MHDKHTKLNFFLIFFISDEFFEAGNFQGWGRFIFFLLVMNFLKPLLFSNFLRL